MKHLFFPPLLLFLLLVVVLSSRLFGDSQHPPASVRHNRRLLDFDSAEEDGRLEADDFDVPLVDAEEEEEGRGRRDEISRVETTGSDDEDDSQWKKHDDEDQSAPLIPTTEGREGEEERRVAMEGGSDSLKAEDVAEIPHDEIDREDYLQNPSTKLPPINIGTLVCNVLAVVGVLITLVLHAFGVDYLWKPRKKRRRSDGQEEEGEGVETPPTLTPLLAEGQWSAKSRATGSYP